MSIKTTRQGKSPARRGQTTARRGDLVRVLQVLRAHLSELAARYHIKSLPVFGSYARRDATATRLA